MQTQRPDILRAFYINQTPSAIREEGECYEPDVTLMAFWLEKLRGDVITGNMPSTGCCYLSCGILLGKLREEEMF
jgi:hypothetical protein